MNHQLNNKTIITLVVISIVATFGAIIFMLLNPQIYRDNCWDKYPHNEEQAIINCEGEN